MYENKIDISWTLSLQDKIGMLQPSFGYRYISKQFTFSICISVISVKLRVSCLPSTLVTPGTNGGRKRGTAQGNYSTNKAVGWILTQNLGVRRQRGALTTAPLKCPLMVPRYEWCQVYSTSSSLCLCGSHPHVSSRFSIFLNWVQTSVPFRKQKAICHTLIPPRIEFVWLDTTELFRFSQLRHITFMQILLMLQSFLT